MLRSLIVLVTSAGLGLAPASIPSPTAPATTLVAAASAVAAAVDDTVAADVTVVDVPLVVVPLADAEAEAEADAGTARAPEAAGAEPAPTPGPGPTAEPGPTPAPAESVTSDGPVAADVLVDGDRVVTPAVEVADAQTVGITWPEGTGGAQLAPELRFRADGGWSEWVALGVADAEPDAGTADAVRAERGGTDSYWIGDADAVQLSFAATRSGGPADISLALVGSPEADAAPAATGAGDGAVIRNAVRSTGEATVLAAATRPSIVTRGQWGARPQVCAPDVAARLSGAVVHHTAGSNAYSTQAQAMQQIRNDQAYHIDARGWCDIGYNFVVDKWGNIYEGRANSLTQAVIGVHASGANTGTVGVSMLGNYDTVATTPAMIGAVGRIIGWRLGNYGIDPHGSGTYPSGLTLPRVIGHRDVTSTACPGRYGYAQLPNIRNIAAANLGDPPYPRPTAQSVVKAMYQDLLGRPVDAAGLATWTDALMSGVGQPALVGSLTSSEEYVRLRVTQAYREVLGREPEPAGLQDWRNRIFAGQATVDDVKRRFYDSQEYYNRSGGSPEGYVDLLYRTMFDRSATAQERTHWAGQIGTVGRAKVVDGIWFSTEAAMWRSGKYYETFLQRTAERSGKEYWAGVLLTRGEGAVRQGIAGSIEYLALAVKRFPS